MDVIKSALGEKEKSEPKVNDVAFAGLHREAAIIDRRLKNQTIEAKAAQQEKVLQLEKEGYELCPMPLTTDAFYVFRKKVI